MLADIKYDNNRTFPLVARAAGRNVVNSLHFLLINAATQELRRQRRAIPIDADEVNNIDNFNENKSSQDEDAESQRNREEQGFTVQESPLVVASLLKIICDEITTDLHTNAGMTRLQLSNKIVPNVFDVPSTLEDSFEQQLNLVPQVSQAVIKAEARALNVSEEDIANALARRQALQNGFLRANRGDILEIVRGLQWQGDDAMDAEKAEERLPAISRLRMISKADNGLFRECDRQIGFHLRGLPDAGGNVIAINAMRNKLLDEVAELMAKDSFKREYDDAISRGSAPVIFLVRPQRAEAVA